MRGNDRRDFPKQEKFKFAVNILRVDVLDESIRTKRWPLLLQFEDNKKEIELFCQMCLCWCHFFEKVFWNFTPWVLKISWNFRIFLASVKLATIAGTISFTETSYGNKSKGNRVLSSIRVFWDIFHWIWSKTIVRKKFRKQCTWGKLTYLPTLCSETTTNQHTK